MTRKNAPVPTKKSTKAPKKRKIIIAGTLDSRKLTAETISADRILAAKVLVAGIKARSVQKKEN
jgi:hypothetical protein